MNSTDSPYPPPPDWNPAAAPKPPRTPFFKRGWVRGTLIGFASFIVGGVIGAGDAEDTSSSTANAPAPAVTITAPAVPAPTVTKTVETTVEKTIEAPPASPSGTIEGNGVFLVGSDVKPGTYRNPADEDSCYWERLKDTESDFNSIISNGNGGRQIVTIKKADVAFSSEDCGTWERIS